MLYSKVPILISKVFILSVVSFSFFSCQQSSQEKSTIQKHKSQSVVSTNKEKSERKPLTDKTVNDFLWTYGKKHKEEIIVIHTDFGDISIRLYQHTPLHRANMLFLANQKYFDGTWFYRVSEGHVIQAGNNDDSKTVNKRKNLGEYTIPAEIGEQNYHKRGAVAAARSYSNNPDKRSDPYEFYIVLGKNHNISELHIIEDTYDLSLSKGEVEMYVNTGGSPHLDKEHTVFGEVIKGMDVVEKISKVKVDEGDWPLVNIPIKVEVKP